MKEFWSKNKDKIILSALAIVMVVEMVLIVYSIISF